MEAATLIQGLLTLVVQSPRPAKAIVILLHGYAMGPQDLSPFASSMRTDCTFYFPQGPQAAATSGFSWWPIDEERRQSQLARGARDLAGENPPSRPLVRRRLLHFIAEVRDRHPTLPLVIGGFSQGGMLACDLVIQETVGAAGLALLSSSRIAAEEWMPRVKTVRGLPVFVSHGKLDSDLSFAAGEALQSMLRDAGAAVTWVPFDGGHEIPLIVWRELKRFLNSLSTA